MAHLVTISIVLVNNSIVVFILIETYGRVELPLVPVIRSIPAFPLDSYSSGWLQAHGWVDTEDQWVGWEKLTF